jgi:hypothetical protein
MEEESVNRLAAALAILVVAGIAVLTLGLVRGPAGRLQVATPTPLVIFQPTPTYEAYFPSRLDDDDEYMSLTEWMTLTMASELIVSRLQAVGASLGPMSTVAARRFLPIDAPAFGYQPRIVADGELPDIALLLHGSFTEETLGIPGRGGDPEELDEYALFLVDRLDGIYAVRCDALAHLTELLPPERTRAEVEELMLPENWGIPFPPE